MAAIDASTSSSPSMGSMPRAAARTSGCSSARSPAGTPTNSPITAIGKGRAKSCMNSTCALSARSSSRSVTQRVHGRTKLLDLARRERTRDQTAEAGVVGRIGQQHVVRTCLEELTTPPPVVAEDAGRRVLDAHAATEARVAQDALALLVAADDVGAERGPADPGLGVHPGVERIGIGLAVGGGQDLEQEAVEGGARGNRHWSPPSPSHVTKQCAHRRSARSTSRPGP